MKRKKAVQRLDDNDDVTWRDRPEQLQGATKESDQEGDRVLVIKDIPAHPNNYGDRPVGMPITLIVLHYTTTGSLQTAVNWFRNPEAKVSAHYVIGKEGEITRMVSEEKMAYHAGKSEWRGHENVNRFSIGIELVNWGKLVRRDGRYFTWPNDYTNPYNGLEPVFLEGEWWEPYPEEQHAALGLLLDDIRVRQPIEAVVGHREISPGRKIDPGPALELPRHYTII